MVREPLLILFVSVCCPQNATTLICNLDEKAWLLFANKHDIRKLDLDVMTMKTIVSELQNAIAVDYDYNNKLVFWSDINEEKIMK